MEVSSRVGDVTAAILGWPYVGCRVRLIDGRRYGRASGAAGVVLQINDSLNEQCIVAFDDDKGNPVGTVVDGRPCWYVRAVNLKPE